MNGRGQLALALAAALLGCGARELRVGSKEFTESVILGEALTRLAQGAGVPAAHRRQLGGTRVLWDALVSGAIDAYPEYTGTLREELLRGLPPGDAALDQALAERGLARTASLGFEDTYAIGVRRAVAVRLGLQTIGDLARHPEVRLGFSHELLDRADGWPRLRERYGLAAQPAGLEHALAYRAVADGALDGTDLYSTDPEIRALDLVVLADDRRAFPEYQAVVLYRRALPAAAVAALRRLEGRVTVERMRALNARARIDHAAEGDVAAELLEGLGATGASAPAEPLWARLWRTTREHLALVAISLAAAIAVAIPLGVLAARRRRLGQLVLGAAGVLQTLPSLALLVLLIPPLGIGAPPAMVALFLYSLLPIVRGTAAGLTAIPAEVRESAIALGLPPWARLRLVELPIAAPAILAGIQTAAVINVGTATLGALVGAGGYGQPILAGIRLASVPLLLEGAVPAAVLALVVQGLFELVERMVVSEGLRV